MNSQIKQKWIDTLKSGEYQQTGETIHLANLNDIGTSFNQIAQVIEEKI